MFVTFSLSTGLVRPDAVCWRERGAKSYLRRWKHELLMMGVMCGLTAQVYWAFVRRLRHSRAMGRDDRGGESGTTCKGSTRLWRSLVRFFLRIMYAVFRCRILPHRVWTISFRHYLEPLYLCTMAAFITISLSTL